MPKAAQKRAMIPVEAVMTRAPAACRPGDTLARAAELMRERRTSWLPVIGAGDRVVGVLTARDACLAAAARGRALDGVPVEAAMHTDVHACSATDDVEDVLVAIQNYRVPRLPVLGPDRALVGVFSLDEAARQLAARGLEGVLARTLASLSEPRSAAAVV
jgi:CBS domain-containing protein